MEQDLRASEVLLPPLSVGCWWQNQGRASGQRVQGVPSNSRQELDVKKMAPGDPGSTKKKIPGSIQAESGLAE